MGGIRGYVCMYVCMAVEGYVTYPSVVKHWEIGGIKQTGQGVHKKADNRLSFNKNSFSLGGCIFFLLLRISSVRGVRSFGAKVGTRNVLS